MWLGEKFFRQVLGFSLPKQFLVFNHSLHAFTIFHIALQFTRRRSFIWSFNINFILSTVDPYSHCKVVIFNYVLLVVILCQI